MLALLQFHPAMLNYVHGKYGSVLQEGARRAVAVHFRMGSAGSRHAPLPQPTVGWYRHVLRRVLNGPRLALLLFTDNVPVLRALLERTALVRGRVHHIVDEDYAHALLMMTLCRHHVLSNAKLPFWGAYLDPRQPSGGVTVVPMHFLESHPIKHLHMREWRVIGEDVAEPEPSD